MINEDFPTVALPETLLEAAYHPLHALAASNPTGPRVTKAELSITGEGHAEGENLR